MGRQPLEEMKTIMTETVAHSEVADTYFSQHFGLYYSL